MTRMAGKVVLITGAGKGMGRTHAVRLAEEGADILAIDLPGEQSRPTWPRPRASCGNWAAARSPAPRTSGTRRAHRGRAGGVRELGPLDTVVANAGICDNPGPSWTIDDDIWNRSIDVNVTGTWHTVKAGVAERTGGGSVVIVSSTAAIKAVPGASHYSAAKHAITGLSKTLANELGKRSIRVNTIHPGAVATPMTINPTTFARLRPDLENRPRPTSPRCCRSGCCCRCRGWSRST